MLIEIIDAAWFWGLMGSVLFTGMLVVHHIWGPGPKVRDEEGNRQRIAPEFRVFVAIEMIVIVSILLVSSMFAIERLQILNEGAGNVFKFSVAYCTLFIINLWDFVVIDWVLVVRFRPESLVWPDTPYFNTVKPHLTGWLVGNFYMLPIAGIALLSSKWI